MKPTFMKPIHGIALTLLCASLSGLTPAAANEETTGTAMLGAERGSTESLRLQLLDRGAGVTADEIAILPPTSEVQIDRGGESFSPSDSAEPVAPVDPLREAVKAQLSGNSPTAVKLGAEERAALSEYYADPDRPLLWVDTKGLTARGQSAVEEIQRADDFGLDAADYNLPELSDFDATATRAAETLAIAEIQVSHAVLQYARDARGGRIDPRRISRNLDPTLVLPKPAEVIQSIAFRSDAGAYLRSFQPQHPQFEALRKKLIALRGGSADTEADKPEVHIPRGPLLRVGDADPQVALLRTRLGVAQGSDPEFFDATLAEAVKRFQKAHNTMADGVVGPGTRRLLNNPQLRHAGSAADIKKILLNMERWRWLPQDKGQFYVTVNVPEFMLRVVKDDETVHTTRVVVGKTKTPTPVFSNDMTHVVFGPYWNVPNSIKTGEIRPYIRPYGGGWHGRRWDTRVLVEHDLRIKYKGQHVNPQAIDWSRVDIRRLHFYQPPSRKNVLGRVKFMFPNKHSVYMHDTNEKHYFKNTVRAESHGCMRVQNPNELAAILLKHDRSWSSDKTQHAFDTAYDKRVTLNNAVPVYITYFTLWVNDDGSITTYGDLYGHD
ncbi:MAG: L,D-transpeptidase family protein, partial [Pseudomonadota bacterium]